MMTTQAKLEMKGFEEYLEKLAQAAVEVDPAVDKAIMAGAEVIQQEMISNVPVGKAPEDPHPGNLRKNIKIDGPHQDGNYHFAEVGLIHKKGFTDDETAIYGNVQEYGNASNQAQPYIRPGIDSGRSRAKKQIVSVLKEEGKL
jgi:HK97 gp10 family phage protein